jgi:hypothetical protein
VERNSPTRMSANPPIAPMVKGSPSSVTPNASATAGLST